MIFENGFDDILSRSDYNSFLACQRMEVFDEFEKLINEEKPELIVEIGTCFGGLSYCLHNIAKKLGLTFISYDIVSNDPIERLLNLGVDIRIENIFNDDYTIKSNILDYFFSFNSRLILCDGGNKIQEFNNFAKVLKGGDFLMAHDFAYDEQYFRDHGIWGWMEIEEKHIMDVMKEKDFCYYNMNRFSKLAWVCTKKLK